MFSTADFDPAQERQRTIDALKAKIATIGPAPRHRQAPIPTGIADVDKRIQGWPVPGVTEISGRLGSGRMQLCLPSLALLSLHHRIGIVDPLRQLNPPGWKGVDLNHLLLIRPPLERAVWSTEQLARSGCFALVGLLDPPRLGRTGARLARASEEGACALLVWTTESDLRTPAKLRIQTQNQQGKRLFIRFPKTDESLWVSTEAQ
jgi:hypothetical protein